MWTAVLWERRAHYHPTMPPECPGAALTAQGSPSQLRNLGPLAQTHRGVIHTPDYRCHECAHGGAVNARKSKSTGSVGPHDHRPGERDRQGPVTLAKMGVTVHVIRPGDGKITFNRIFSSTRCGEKNIINGRFCVFRCELSEERPERHRALRRWVPIVFPPPLPERKITFLRPSCYKTTPPGSIWLIKCTLLKYLCILLKYFRDSFWMASERGVILLLS